MSEKIQIITTCDDYYLEDGTITRIRYMNYNDRDRTDDDIIAIGLDGIWNAYTGQPVSHPNIHTKQAVIKKVKPDVIMHRGIYQMKNEAYLLLDRVDLRYGIAYDGLGNKWRISDGKIISVNVHTHSPYEFNIIRYVGSIADLSTSISKT